jgi:hypothetical protein
MMSALSFRVIPVDGGPWADDTTAARQHRAAGLVYQAASHFVPFRLSATGSVMREGY